MISFTRGRRTSMLIIPFMIPFHWLFVGLYDLRALTHHYLQQPFLSCWGRTLKVPGHYFGNLRSSEQHGNGCVLLARYDFLLVSYRNVTSRWNRCRVLHHWNAPIKLHGILTICTYCQSRHAYYFRNAMNGQRDTDILIAILCTPPLGEVMIHMHRVRKHTFTTALSIHADWREMESFIAFYRVVNVAWRLCVKQHCLE